MEETAKETFICAKCGGNNLGKVYISGIRKDLEGFYCNTCKRNLNKNQVIRTIPTPFK